MTGFWKSLSTILFLLIAVIVACNSKQKQDTNTRSAEPVYFSKNWKAEIGFPGYRNIGFLRTKSGDMLAYFSTPEGLLQSTSSDNGRSWTPPTLAYPDENRFLPLFIGDQLIGKVTYKYTFNGGQIYFQARQGDDWAEPSPIRDTNWGSFESPNFAADSCGNLYCAWIDRREGNQDVYFSSSFDSGQTWTSNVRIDDDESGQEQWGCQLLSTPEGVLYAFWDDNRNPKTLFDIYCSASSDSGKTWSPSVKVNDDTTHVWQKEPAPVLAPNGNLFVTWVDFRDKEVGGDITSNIYFSRSEDGGKIWSPNLGISAAKFGGNLGSVLVRSPDGELMCIWQNTENNLNYDVSFSYSRDRGRTWSLPVRVNDDTVRAHHVPVKIIPNHHGNVLIAWLDWREKQSFIYMAELIKHPDPSRPKRKPRGISITGKNKLLLTVEAGDTLFQDYFITRPSPLWEITSGTWVWKDQTYIAYGINEARNFVGSETWDNYIFKGRFLLDPLNHHNAILYLRVFKTQDGRLSYYRLSNIFRIGVILEYFDGENSVPMADAPYFFQKNTWYDFRTLVKDNVLNYFVGDSLVIAAETLTHTAHGRVGIGAEDTPIYFKDIVVTTIK